MGLLTLLMYLVLLAGAMMIAAGAFGAFPLGAGILSFLAMLGLTLGPFLLFPSFPFDTRNYGIGFWALWGLSILMLFAASWTRTGRKRNEFSQNAPMESGVKPPQVG